VVDSVENDGDPPPELSLALMCQRWKTLPDAGGMYEQDARVIKRMSGVLSIHGAINRWRTLTGKNIHQLTEGERRILKMLKDLGFMLR
jgi:hypothetical protein